MSREKIDAFVDEYINGEYLGLTAYTTKVWEAARIDIAQQKQQEVEALIYDINRHLAIINQLIVENESLRAYINAAYAPLIIGGAGA